MEQISREISNKDYINDVMSESENQEPHASLISQTFSLDYADASDNRLSDDILDNLLSKTNSLARSTSTLHSTHTILPNIKSTPKPWTSLMSVNSSQQSHVVNEISAAKSPKVVSGQTRLQFTNFQGSSGYGGSEELHLSNWRSNLPTVHTIPDTTSLINTLQNELVQRTKELHCTEDENFNLKAELANIKQNKNNKVYQTANSDELYYQIKSKDKLIRQLHSKISHLNNSLVCLNDEVETKKNEVEETQTRLAHLEHQTDSKTEYYEQEIRKRDEIVEKLRQDISETSSTSRLYKTNKDNEVRLKEKVNYLESELQKKEDKIDSLRDALKSQSIKAEELQKISDNFLVKESEWTRELDLVKQELANAKQHKERSNQTLTETQKFYEDSKAQFMQENKQQSDLISQLTNDNRELDRKHRELTGIINEKNTKIQQLQDNATQIQNKIISLEQNISHRDNNIQSLTTDNIELAKRFESLRSQFVDLTTSETQRNNAKESENQNQMEYMEKLTRETIELNRRLDEYKDKIACQQETIQNLNKQIVEEQSNKEIVLKQSKTFEDELQKLQYREKELLLQQKEMDNRLDNYDKDIGILQKQLDSCKQENLNLQSTIRETERKLERNEEKYKYEIQILKEDLEHSKTDLSKWKGQITVEKEEEYKLIKERDSLTRELDKMTKKLVKFEEELTDSRNNEMDLEMKINQLKTHNSSLEEQLTSMKLALEDSSDELKILRKSLDSKEASCERHQTELDQSNASNYDLIAKIEERDELLRSLSNETSKLKDKFKLKSNEYQKLTIDHESQSAELCKVTCKLKETETKLEEMKKKRQDNLSELKAQLESSQDQYNDCYGELMRREDQLHQLQNQDKEKQEKLSKIQSDLLKSQQDFDELECEVVGLRGKYKSVCDEMARRDDQLQANTNQMEELRDQITQLVTTKHMLEKQLYEYTDQISAYETQIKHQENEHGNLEDKLSEKDHNLDAITNQLTLAKQEIINQTRTIDQLGHDMTLMKSTANERQGYLQSIVENLKTELQTSRTTIDQLETRNTKSNQQLTQMQAQLQQHVDSHVIMKDELDQTKNNLQQKDSECQHWMEKLQSENLLLHEAKSSIDSVMRENSSLKQELTMTQTKIKQQKEQITKQKTELAKLFKSLLQLENQSEMANRDLQESDKIKEEFWSKVRQLEACVKDLNGELETAQIDEQNSQHKIRLMEQELNNSVELLRNKEVHCEEIDKKLLKLKQNFEKYKLEYQTKQEDVDRWNQLLLEQTKKCVGLEDKITAAEKEFESIKLELSRKSEELRSAERGFELMRTQLENLVKENSINESKLTEKHNGDLKKLRGYSKKLEKELGELRKILEQRNEEMSRMEGNLMGWEEKENELLFNLEQQKDHLLRYAEREKMMREEIKDLKKCKQNHDKNGEIRQSKYCNECDEYEVEMRHLKKQLLGIKEENETLNKQTRDMERELAGRVEAFQTKNTEINEMRKAFDSYTQEIDGLKQNHQQQCQILEKTKQDVERYARQYELVNVELQANQKSLEQTHYANQQIKKEMESRLEHQNLLEEQVEQQEQLIIELQTELEDIQGKYRESLSQRNHNREYNQEIEEQQSSSSINSQLSKELEKLQGRLVQERQQTDKVRGDNRMLRSNSITAENQLKVIQKHLQNTQAELAVVKQKLIKLENESSPREMPSDRTDYILELEQALQASQLLVEQLRRQIQSSNARPADVHSTNQNAASFDQQINLTELSRKLILLDAEKQQALDQCQKLRIEIDRLKNELGKQKVTSANLMKDNGELKQVIEQRDHQLQDHNDKFNRLQRENERIVTNFTDWIDEQKMANGKLGEKIREKNQTIKDLYKEIETLKQSMKHDSNSLSKSKLEEVRLLKSQLTNAEKQFDRILRDKTRTIEQLQSNPSHLTMPSSSSSCANDNNTSDTITSPITSSNSSTTTTASTLIIT